MPRARWLGPRCQGGYRPRAVPGYAVALPACHSSAARGPGPAGTSWGLRSRSALLSLPSQLSAGILTWGTVAVPCGLQPSRQQLQPISACLGLNGRQGGQEVSPGVGGSGLAGARGRLVGILRYPVSVLGVKGSGMLHLPLYIFRYNLPVLLSRVSLLYCPSPEDTLLCS